MNDCVFCRILTGTAPATITHQWDDAVALIPLNPVTDGHQLVIPRTHVRDLAENPDVTAATMRRAAQLAGAHSDVNLITSRGPHATQTVHHLHLHLVPRRPQDGLTLPWTTHPPTSNA